MIPSNLCYVPPSVEFLGLTTPSFQIRIHNPSPFSNQDPQFSNQIDAPRGKQLINRHASIPTGIICPLPSNSQSLLHSNRSYMRY